MKKKDSFLKILLACGLLVAISAGITGCKGTPREGYTMIDGFIKADNPAAMVVILGNHANAMAVPPDAYNVVEASLNKVVYGGYICAVIADATPTKIELVDDDDFFIENARNDTTLGTAIDKRKGQIMKTLENLDVCADSPEVDLLAAIREAKNALSNSRLDGISDKRIFIIDTGISTAGDLNFVDMDFTRGLPDIGDIVEQLQRYEGLGVLPDLAGITVTFVGTGDGLAEVAAPQIVSTVDKKFIKNLWTEVVRACGAADIRFETVAGWDTPNVYTEDADSKFPYVSVIIFVHKKVIDFSDLFKVDPNHPDDPPTLPDPPVVEIKLPSETVGFKPDYALYLNEQNAKNILRPFAEELKEFFQYFPDEKIWIIGTTSAVYPGASGSIQLSLERAELVRTTLVTEFDIPEKNLVTIGLGARFPWFVDEYPNGSYDTTIAQQNRAVWLITARENSDLFGQLKDAYGRGELLPEAADRFAALSQ